MRRTKYLMVFVLLGICLAVVPNARAQRVVVGVGVGPGYVGPAPVCAYGYYPDYPYACAPYGYYGPSWFSSGVFIGAGPWFHGFFGRGFHGRGFRERGFFDRPGFAGRGRGFGGRGGFVGRGPGFGARGGFRGGSGFHGGMNRLAVTVAIDRARFATSE